MDNAQNILPGEYTLVNLHEVGIKEIAREHLEKSGACNCEKCLMDICALALNHFSGEYVVLKKTDPPLTAIDIPEGVTLAVEEAVSKVVDTVKSRPLHD